MPNNWKIYKLSDFIDINPLVKLKANEQYSFVEMKDLDANLKTVKPSAFKILKGGAKFQNNDTLFARITPCLENGKICQVRDLENNVGFGSTEFLVFRGKKDISDTDFVYYLSREPFVRQFAEANMIGTSGRQRVAKEAFQNIELELPPLQEQQSIASILSSIDDKIENNLAINKTLEEMAMALYKHWFVDFGPFQEGEFVESELGLIPKGWEVKTLEYFIEVLSKGTTPRMKDVEGFERKIPFLKVKDINSNGDINLNGLELIPEEIHLKDLKRSILLENDLLFSIAGTIGRVSIVTENLNNSNCNQALAFIRLKEKEKFKSIVYYWLKSDEVQNRIENSVVQGVQANVSLTVLKELEFIKPTNDVIVTFSNKANPILEQVLKNQKENQTLTQLRDTVLPKLISGEVRLKEFREKVV